MLTGDSLLQLLGHHLAFLLDALRGHLGSLLLRYADSLGNSWGVSSGLEEAMLGGAPRHSLSPFR